MSRFRSATPGLKYLLASGVLACSESGSAWRQLPSLVHADHWHGALSSASALTRPWLLSFAARPLSSAAEQGGAYDKGTRSHNKQRGPKHEGLVAAEEEFSAITDKIPQRPITVAEGTSYTLVIVAALGFAAAVLYAALNELVFSPKEYKCYTHTLDKIKDDPRVTVRIGSPVSAYGTESRNRAARQRIPHRLYTDEQGREHVQLQFHMRGPSGRAVVNADMYQDGGQWRYNFLYLSVESPVPQQVVLIRPGQDY